MEQRSNKYIITKYKGAVLSALFKDGRLSALELHDRGEILGNIYVGKVSSMAKNICAAFVDFEDGKTGYLKLDKENSDRFCRDICVGKELAVQVEREDNGQKEPVLTTRLSVYGRYLVLKRGGGKLFFSSKIRDAAWKDKISADFSQVLGTDLDAIVRTNAYSDEEGFFSEAGSLKDKLCAIMAVSDYRTCHTKLYEKEAAYLTNLLDIDASEEYEIVTDDDGIYGEASAFLRLHGIKNMSARLYADRQLPLFALYSLGTAIEKAQQRRVWLDCGGYLVIDQTEAMTVVDVNSGKCIDKKDRDATALKINLEAARETLRQLRIRNLSGIIIIDFIDMTRDEDKKQLMETLRMTAKTDPVKTTVVDLTALGLCEMTRHRVKKTFAGQLSQVESGQNKA